LRKQGDDVIIGASSTYAVGQEKTPGIIRIVPPNYAPRKS